MSTSELIRVRVDSNTIIVMTLDEARHSADDRNIVGVSVTPAFWGDNPDEVVIEDAGNTVEVYTIEVYFTDAAKRYRSSRQVRHEHR